MLSTTQNLQTTILNSINVIRQSNIMSWCKNFLINNTMTESELFRANNKLAKSVKLLGLEAEVERTQYRHNKEAGYSSIRNVKWNDTCFVSATEMLELENSLKVLLPDATTVKVSVEGLETDCASYNTSSFQFYSLKPGDVFLNDDGQFINSCDFGFSGHAKLQNGGKLSIFIVTSPMYIVDALIAQNLIEKV